MDVILVVEDQPAMQRTLRLDLELAGYEVETAADGQEALNILNQRPVDLILADVAMPRMNGYQLYEEVRRRPRWGLIPFVFVSARALDSDVRYGKALGADDYLTKPFALEDLLAIVAGRLRRAQQLTQTIAPAIDAPATSDAASEERGILTAGALRISHEQHRVWKDGVLVALAPREFSLLECLAQQPDRAVPLMELCQATHGSAAANAEAAGELIYPLIRSLRRHLGVSAGEIGCIESVRGIGYRLVL